MAFDTPFKHMRLKRLSGKLPGCTPTSTPSLMRASTAQLPVQFGQHTVRLITSDCTYCGSAANACSFGRTVKPPTTAPMAAVVPVSCRNRRLLTGVSTTSVFFSRSIPPPFVMMMPSFADDTKPYDGVTSTRRKKPPCCVMEGKGCRRVVMHRSRVVRKVRFLVHGRIQLTRILQDGGKLAIRFGTDERARSVA